jgi:hypothetical protein
MHARRLCINGSGVLAAKFVGYRMAIFHLSVKTISRSAGRSATAAIAYRAGERVMDERTGLVHDYTRRRGIEHTEIFLPENSPAWATDRAQLWNAAELAETRKNSTVAREFEVAIPAELNQAQRLELVREFALDLVQRHGMAVDIAIHAPGRDGDNRNHHAHILCSTRRLTPEGFKDKTRELDDQKSGEVGNWRERWANLSNRHLETAGRQERIDHRSLGVQRAAAIERGDTEQAIKLDRVPTIHLGPNVVQMERRGVVTERGDHGRETAKHNAQIINLVEARKRVEAERAEHERHNDNGRNRQATRRDERYTGAEPTRRIGRLVDQPDIRSIGVIPPPAARGRLRNLSELGVVRFPERGQMLLSGNVSRDVEHQRAEPDNALRRGSDGLTAEKPATAREVVQRELNADLLRRAMADREPAKPANDPSPEVVKEEWQQEKARQFSLVVNRAKPGYAMAAKQVERQNEKLEAHDLTRPREPSGLFAGFRKATHDQAINTWRNVRAGLETRWGQINNRLAVIGDFMRKAGPYEMPTRGERLAERLAERARPELATSFNAVMERDTAEKMAQARVKSEARKTINQERNMKQESIEELKQRIDTTREKTERKELKAHQQAVLGAMNAEQQFDLDQTTHGQAQAVARELNSDNDRGDKTKEARRKEIADRFKAKARSDRDNDRGRGR